MNFSLEISPTTDLDTVPSVNDIYITMLPGGNYKETAHQAVELVKRGFNPVPHFPARSMHNEKELKDYISRCRWRSKTSFNNWWWKRACWKV